MSEEQLKNRLLQMANAPAKMRKEQMETRLHHMVNAASKLDQAIIEIELASKAVPGLTTQGPFILEFHEKLHRVANYWAGMVVQHQESMDSTPDTK